MPRPFACRSCGSDRLDVILRLGQMPLANAYLTCEELARPEQTYPLDLVFCSACSLVQITETVPPDVLFRDYLYFTSYSDTSVRSARFWASNLLQTSPRWQFMNGVFTLSANSLAPIWLGNSGIKVSVLMCCTAITFWPMWPTSTAW